MSNKTIFVLGGYGGTGKVICRRLLESTDVNLIIAGRHLEEAEKLARELKDKFPDRNISAVFADAEDSASLQSAVGRVNLIIDATTATKAVQNVARAAIKAGADYLDFHFEQNVVGLLRALDAEIKKVGRVFITQAGFHPGLPAAFARFAAPQFDIYRKAIIGMAMNSNIEKPESIYELVDMLADYKVDIFKNKKWQRAGWRDLKKIDFGKRFGIRSCYPLEMEEMKILPEMFPALEETGVYAAGFNWFIDYFVFPLAFILFTIKKGLGRHLIAKLLVFGFNNFSKNNRGVSFVLEAEGEKAGKQIKYRVMAEHEDAYEFTAIPVIACVRQYLNGGIADPGLYLMGQVVEPNRLIKDIEEMGVKITYNK